MGSFCRSRKIEVFEADSKESIQSVSHKESNDALEETQIADDANLYSSSEKVLNKLHLEGKEFITNVAVFDDSTSADICKKVGQEHANRLNFILTEQTRSEEQFNKIISKWDNAPHTKIPKKWIQLRLELKIECENHLKAKDVVISKLREDIDGKNKQFAIARGQQDEEEKLMGQRIKEFIFHLRKSAEHEMATIEYALKKMQSENVNDVAEKLEKELSEKEACNEKYEVFHEDVWKRTHNLRRARLIAHNELASFRQLLENDLHNFFLQLKATESVQFLNLDKFKYGLYILQEQVKENKLISCDRKRFNIYAFDQLLVLKRHLKSIDRKGKHAYVQQLADVSKAKTKLMNLIRGAKQSHLSMKNTFYAVSNEQEAEIMKLLHQVLKVDAFICKSFLCLDWEAPDLSFLKKEKEKAQSREQKLKKWIKFFTQEISSGNDTSENFTENITTDEESQNITETGSFFYVQRPLNVEKLLEFICGELDFLIDQKVLELSKTNFVSIKTFLLTNSIFNAIGVKTCGDLNVFMAHILNHARPLDDDDKLILGSRDILMGFQDFVLLQKKKFVSDEMFFNEMPISDVRKESSFWMPYARVIPPEKEKLWDAVIYALEKHHSALETLCHLSERKVRLLQEKQELRRLLQKTD